MGMAKFKEAVKEMWDEHKEEFSEFLILHDNYRQDQKKWQAEFNEKGKAILDWIQKAENRLCSKQENSGRANYSPQLAEKFREEVKKYLPLIDWVGVEMS